MAYQFKKTDRKHYVWSFELQEWVDLQEVELGDAYDSNCWEAE